MVQVDFFFLNRREDSSRATGLTLCDVSTSAIGACGIPKKGRGLYVVEWILSELDSWGFLNITLRSDQESAIKSIVDEVVRRRKLLGLQTLVEKAPRYSHASLGTVERGNQSVEKQVRVILAVLKEHRLDPVDVKKIR